MQCLFYNRSIALIIFVCVAFSNYSPLHAQLYIVEGTTFTISNANAISVDSIHVISKKGKKKVNIYIAEGRKITGKFTSDSDYEIVYAEISKPENKQRIAKNVSKIKETVVEEITETSTSTENTPKKGYITAHTSSKTSISGDTKNGLITAPVNNRVQKSVGVVVQLASIPFSKNREIYNSYIEDFIVYFYSSSSSRGPPSSYN